MNGSDVASIADFEKLLRGTPVGGKLTFDILRDGKQTSISMARPEPKGQVIIRKSTK